jgi:hypothetical protein
VACIFTRTLSDDLASLVKTIDKQVADNKDKDMKAFVVLLTDDPDAGETKLKAFAEKHGIKHVPLTIYDGVAGPPSYKVAKEAELTVLLWRGQKVKVNHAFKKGEFKADHVKTIGKDTAKILE